MLSACVCKMNMDDVGLYVYVLVLVCCGGLCLCGEDMMMVVGWLCMITDFFLVVVFVVVAGLVVFLRFDLVWFRYFFSFVRLISKNKFIYYYFILQYDFFFFLFNEIIKTILLFQALELTWYKK